MLISDYDYKHKTEAELIIEIEKQENEIPDDETIYTRGVLEDTKYHIMSLAYDKKGNRGELVDVTFKSPMLLNDTDDAWCKFENAGTSSSKFLFSVLKRGRCSTYDVIYGANIYQGYLSGPLMAFELNYYNNKKKKNWLSERLKLKIETNYPNDHTFSCDYSEDAIFGGVIATTWGRFADGSMSSDITTIAADTFADEITSTRENKQSAIDWIRSQKGWIKTVPKDFE